MRYLRSALSWKGKSTVPDYGLMFRCPKCGWWIVGQHSPEQSVSRETLDQTRFDLKCSFKDCGWIGQLSGSEAQQYLSSTGASARKP
jgi:hypothetical protein